MEVRALPQEVPGGSDEEEFELKEVAPQKVSREKACATRIRIAAEARAEENKKPGKDIDIGELDISKEMGAVYLGESDVKFDETVFEFINSTWRECEDELY